MIQLRDKSPSIVLEVAKLASSNNGRRRYYVWEILKCCWKRLRVWWEFEDSNNRPPSIPWNWVHAIFLWVQGRRKFTCKKSIPNLSSYSQHSQRLTGPIHEFTSKRRHEIKGK